MFSYNVVEGEYIVFHSETGELVDSFSTYNSMLEAYPEIEEC